MARRRRLKKKGYKLSGEEDAEEEVEADMINEKVRKRRKMPDRRLRLEDTIPPPRGFFQ